MSFEVTDRNGHVWSLAITLAGANRVEGTSFDLYTKQKISFFNPGDTFRETFSELMTNSPLLFAVIFRIVEPQVNQLLQIDPVQNRAAAEEAFMDSIDGRTASEMREKFWDAVADFFPENRTALLAAKEQMQESLRKVDQHLKDLTPRMREILDAQIQQGVQKLRDQLDQELLKITGTPSGT